MPARCHGSVIVDLTVLLARLPCIPWLMLPFVEEGTKTIPSMCLLSPW